MNLTDLGFTKELSFYLTVNKLSNFSTGRVTQEHRERYVVSDGENEYEAEISGNLRFSANSRADFPAVGDWVTLTIFDSANIEPILVISKIDMSTEKEIRDAISDLEKRDKKIKYILLSNVTLKGLDQILDFIQPGKTYCVVGSSGVGKSTLINNLLKKNILKTGQISHSTNKGRHVTDHRELFVLENGGIIIDTPGMRELGMTDKTEGIKSTFQEIFDISLNCKFPDCKHFNEKGCAVIEALNNGTIDKDSYDNYKRIRKEQVRFQTTIAEKRKKEKVFGKMIKNYYKDKRNEY